MTTPISASANETNQQEISDLKAQIVKYVKRKTNEELANSKTIRLLSRIFEVFMKDEKSLALSLQHILNVIEQRLSRIEIASRSLNELDKITKSSYVVVIVATLIDFEQSKSSKHKSAKKTLMKKRREKKLMIHIVDNQNKENVEKIIIKMLANSLRERCANVIDINRLISDDIKMFARSQKIKENLQKNID